MQCSCHRGGGGWCGTIHRPATINPSERPSGRLSPGLRPPMVRCGRYGRGSSIVCFPQAPPFAPCESTFGQRSSLARWELSPTVILDGDDAGRRCFVPRRDSVFANCVLVPAAASQLCLFSTSSLLIAAQHSSVLILVPVVVFIVGVVVVEELSVSRLVVWR